jgi:hypothetical protein
MIVPRLVIAGTHSAVGKTTVTLAILAALKAALGHPGGLTVTDQDDGRVAVGEADAHDRLTSGDHHGYDQLLLLHHVLDESDLATDLHLFKNRSKGIDERPARKRPQVCRKWQGRYHAGIGSF